MRNYPKLIQLGAMAMLVAMVFIMACDQKQEVEQQEPETIPQTTPPPDTMVVPDTTTMPPDTVVVPDTTRAPGDTTGGM